MNNRPRIKSVLAFARSGSHFIWSRCITSGNYQLIYDADRIAALAVLSEVYDKKLDFLNLQNVSPNYHFQYNSLSETSGALTAKEHLGFLRRKYSAGDNFDLFCRILERQDCSGRTLLMVNRAVYTMHYNYLFKNFEWTVNHALKALRLLYSWFEKAGYQPSYSMVIRHNPEWLYSALMLLGKEQAGRIRGYLEDSGQVLKTCHELKIPIFWMKDVIDQINQGFCDYEHRLSPVSPEDWRSHWTDTQQYIDMLDNFKKGRKAFRLDRFIQYVSEKNPIERISLVRSIGFVPISMAYRLPIGLGKRIIEDDSRVALDNSCLKNSPIS